MTLRRKMAMQTGALIASFLLISAASLWGLLGLEEDYSVALRGNSDLREVYEIGTHLLIARRRIGPAPDQRREAADEVRNALARVAIDRDPARLKQGEGDAPPMSRKVRDAVEAALSPLAQLNLDAASPDALSEALDSALRRIGDINADIGRTIRAGQESATSRRVATTLLMGALCSAGLSAALWVALKQYRGVMRPLGRLGEGVRRIAGGGFEQRLSESGDEEFASLAQDFNRMAAHLEQLYRTLEQKVAEKSRALVRSERLASVGFLAAGVAHEINNPLGIISGYAEYSLKLLEREENGSSAAADAINTLRIICDEAFRCKDITQKLLSLARPAADGRKAVSMSEVAASVVSLVGALADHRGRVIEVDLPSNDPCAVTASEGEMKQVMLNLVLNALEASAPKGRVTVRARRDQGRISLIVSDDGRGMSSETLEHVFEPFFTEKRGSRQPGMGLGLSITHAIVESSGGAVTARSDGPGRGSTFIVELPAADPESAALQEAPPA